jgi:rhodanese-related sulfurtransferase
MNPAVSAETSAEPGPVSVDEMLASARARLCRLEPREAHEAQMQGAVLIDIRGDEERARDGVVRGACFVPRNVLEWRMDPRSPHRDPALARSEAHIMLICDGGYQSSLAAATLQRLGLPRATDIVGGFQAWRRAGLPVEPV